MNSLSNKRVLVTGASSGIGKGIAQAFGKSHAKVLVHYHDNKRDAGEVVEEIRKHGGVAFSYAANLAKPEEIDALFAKVNEHLGGLDVLVANAGIQKDSSFLKMKLEDWKMVIDVNLTGQFLCAQKAAKIFCSNKISGERSAKGNIIFTSSVHDAIPWAGHVNYAASKGGLKLLMESIAQELAGDKIRVNSISPGAIKTPINKDAWENPEDEKELLKLIPYGRVGETDDVAQAALWLASDDSDYVIGTTLYVDGGMMLYPAFREGG